MSVLILGTVLGVLGVAVLVIELRRAPTSTTATAGARVAVMGALGALVLVALSPSLALVDLRDLPVERPAEPWRDATGGCGRDDGLGAGVMAIALAIYVAVRGGPAVIAMVAAAARRRPGAPRRLPDGRAALRVATIAFAVTGGLATARLAAGGAAPEAFTTYGALTPAGARGWRVDAALALTLGASAPIATGAPIADELAHHPGSHMPPASGPFTLARAGLQAWVGAQAVLFHVGDAGRVVGAPVSHRDPAMIPPARRPHFGTWPRVARLDDRHLAIVGTGADGGVLAVKVSDYDLGAVAATYADAGLLVRPRWWPWLLGAIVGAAGVALGRRAQRRDHPAHRLIAAWLLLEATAVMTYGHLAALGLPLAWDQ